MSTLSSITSVTSAVKAVLGLYVAAMIIVGAIVITLFVIRAIGYMYLLEGLEKGDKKWFGFLPVFADFGLGIIADNCRLDCRKKSNFFTVFLGVSSILSVGLAIFTALFGTFAVVEAAARVVELTLIDEAITPSILTPFVTFGLLALTASAVNLANKIVSLIALHRIYRIFTPETAVLKTVFSVFLYPLTNIFVWGLRNCDTTDKKEIGDFFE